MTRTRWALLAAALLALDVWLCLYRWSDMVGNLEAQVVIVTPAFLLHHVLMRRHVDRKEEARKEEERARHLEQRTREQAMERKLTELHDFHVRGKLPDRELRPWLHSDPAEPTA
jgi:hypothetical protein